MHPLFYKADLLSNQVIGAAIEMHREKGPGFEDCLLIEVKAVEKILPIHKAQLLSYMKLLDVPLGLLINFHEVVLKSGISRVILPGANQP